MFFFFVKNILHVSIAGEYDSKLEYVDNLALLELFFHKYSVSSHGSTKQSSAFL